MGEGDSGYQFGSGIGEEEVARLEVMLCGAAFLMGRGGAGDDSTPAPSASPSTSVAPRADVELRTVAGVDLPFSELHGPRITTDGRAAGYSQSELGAAISRPARPAAELGSARRPGRSSPGRFWPGCNGCGAS